MQCNPTPNPTTTPAPTETLCESRLEQFYLYYLQTQYPDYEFETLGFGSATGLTRAMAAYYYLSASGVNLLASNTGVYAVDSAYFYVWYNAKVTLFMDNTTSLNFHTCGRCSRQVQCCR